jgi:hypothetical protein
MLDEWTCSFGCLGKINVLSMISARAGVPGRRFSPFVRSVHKAGHTKATSISRNVLERMVFPEVAIQ